MNSPPDARFVYVVGRRHSGSTLLGILLGAAADTVNLGELGLCLGDTEHVCSCGARVADCPFWSRVIRATEGGEAAFLAAGATVRRFAPIRHFWRFLFAGRRDPAVVATLRAHRIVLDALARASGSHHFLDSSKGLPRALLLARFDPSSHVIHLVRHPYGVLASHFWRFSAGERLWLLGSRGGGRGRALWWLALVALAWTAGSLLAELVTAFAPRRVIRVRYEDLYRDPDGELRRIARFCGIDVEPVIARLARGEPFASGHVIGGNQIRFERTIVLDHRRDRARELPFWARALAFALCWPMMLRHGYSPSGRTRFPPSDSDERRRDAADAGEREPATTPCREDEEGAPVGTGITVP